MLELRHVVAGYGRAMVLRDVTMTVPRGSVTALLGANGAGKTTVLRTASGAIAPTSGRVIFEGGDLTGRPIEVIARHGIAHIPEGRAIFPSMTVRENVLLFSPSGAEDEAVGRAVDAFPALGERLNQPAGRLSGGEQQMLALTRCYVTDPKMVLLDEVSLGLAPRIVDQVFEFLKRLVSSGAALLLVEQYVARALDLADYVYVMDRGQIAFAGEPDELERSNLLSSYLGEVAV